MMIGGAALLGIANLLARKLRIRLPAAAWATLIGAWVIAISLFPYWLFGRYSAIGWYDEYDHTIPSFIAIAHSPSPHTFLPDYVGGASVGSLLYYNDTLSLYAEMIRLVGAQAASLLFRFAGMLALYSGVYLSARRLFALRKEGAIVAGLTALFITAYPYAWTLGGYGWNIPLFVWAGYVFFGWMSAPVRMLFATALGAIAAMTASFFTLMPWLAAYLLVLWVLLPVGLPSLLRRDGVPAVIFTAIIVGANLPVMIRLSDAYAQLARFMGLHSLAAFESYFGRHSSAARPTIEQAIAGAYDDFGSVALRGLDFLTSGNPDTLLGFPLTIVFVSGALGIALWLALSGKGWRPFAALVGGTGVIFLLDFIAAITRIPAFSGFRWDTTCIVVTPLVGFLWGRLCDEAGLRRGLPAAATVAYLVFAGTLIVSSTSLAQRALETIDAHGGWPVLSSYPVLRELGQSHPFVRVASMPQYYPKDIIAPFNGLAAMDGTRIFTWRRTAFWFLTLVPQTEWQPERQTLGRDLDAVNLDALAMANVGYLLSTSGALSKKFHLVAKQPGLKLAGAPLAWADAMAHLLPGFSLLPPIYVFQLNRDPWPRVFAPAAIIAGSAPDTDPAYYIQLRALPRLSVLAPANAPDWLRSLAGTQSPIAILGLKQTDTGIAIRTNGSAGVLVYDQEFTATWRAQCGTELLELAPVNGIMIAIKVPAGCESVNLSID